MKQAIAKEINERNTQQPKENTGQLVRLRQ
jgi:hypothetical protein